MDVGGRGGGGGGGRCRAEGRISTVLGMTGTGYKRTTSAADFTPIGSFISLVVDSWWRHG